MKFFLVFQMCYQITHTCLPPINSGLVFDTFRDCTLTGYKKSHDMILGLPPEKVKNYQTIIKFWCDSKLLPPKEEKGEDI